MVYKIALVLICVLSIFLFCQCVIADDNFDISARFLSPPANFSSSLTQAVTVNLTWVKGDSADTTVIVRKPDSYPNNRLDGIEVYNSTGSQFIDGSVVAGNHYFYCAFSCNHSANLYTSDFVGTNITVVAPALFDIKNVIVLDRNIPLLSIVCTVENAGGEASDITINWTLTRMSDNHVLNNGSDTFAVPAGGEVLYTAYPATNYIGLVKILFKGGNPTASAYFETIGTGGTSGSGGGGSILLPSETLETGAEPPSMNLETLFFTSIAVVITILVILVYGISIRLNKITHKQ